MVTPSSVPQPRRQRFSDRWLRFMLPLALMLSACTGQGQTEKKGVEPGAATPVATSPAPQGTAPAAKIQSLTGPVGWKSLKDAKEAPRAALITQDKPKEERSLSPYFFIPGGDPQVDKLPLKSTSADVDIAGVIADVAVTQVYQNLGQKPIEAVYVFPGSTRAAVYAMKMTVGERVIEAQIQRREEARQAYEKAKAEGKSASLLEQQRPNVFQMNVANIMPGDMIQVEMKYTELLVPTDGIYEFVYPTVVGPRYSNQDAETAPEQDKWVANPYQKSGEAPTYGFDLTATLSAGLPVSKVAVPTHKALVQFDGPEHATLALDASESTGGNRDFVLQYQLAGGQVQSGLLLYPGKDGENFFLLMNQPPARVTDANIPPREYLFILDVSGSMQGFPLDITKTLMRNLSKMLRPEDRFNVLLFSGGNSLMAPASVPATEGNLKKAFQTIDNLQGGGGTELLPALQRALSLPVAEGFSRSVIIATDGYVSVETQAFDYIREHLGDANLFAFGIGSSVNRFLIEGMARAGMGEPFVAQDQAKAAEVAGRLQKYIQSPVLTDVAIQYDGFEAYDVEPKSIPDVMAERPVIVFGKYKGTPRGRIMISGITGREPYSMSFDAAKVAPREDHVALRYLWARHRIATLGDYQQLSPRDDRKEEITLLGLKYNLLTAFTSFVAVDSEVRNKDGKSEKVKQPLPLPQGVADSAVGGPARAVGGSLGTTGMGYGGGGAAKGLGAYPAAPPAPMAASPASEAVPRPLLSRARKEAAAVANVEELDDAGEPSMPNTGLAEDKKQSQLGAITVKKVTVSGELSELEAMKSLRQQTLTMRICYARALTVDGTLRGDLTFRLEVTPDGKIKTVTLVNSGNIKDTIMLNCIKADLQRLVFPKHGKASVVTVVLSLVR